MNIVRNTPPVLVVALLLGCAHALAGTEETDRKAPAPQSAPQSYVRATGMIGREIADSSGQVFGEVEEYLIDANGQAFAVIAMGGFLGLAEREVIVPHASIEVTPTAPELLRYRGGAAALEHASRLRPEGNALRAAAKERELLVEVREESEDVSQAERKLQDARSRLHEERKELIAAEKARQQAVDKD